MKKQTVTVVGSWHLGSVIGACLAQAGQEVHLWDQNPQVGLSWQSGRPPIHEPGLFELVKKHWSKNLFWSNSLRESLKKSDWIIISYDTPITNSDDLVMDSVKEGLQTVLKTGFKDDACFLITSQIPVGTSRKFRDKIKQIQTSWKGHVVYQPENLRLGEAITSFQTPDRAVLGVDAFMTAESSGIVASFQELLQNFSTPLNIMSLESAEMVKHALNSFLATCVVFANELSEICERRGANCWDVVASLKQDSRVGPKAFLRPGLGFSGGTLARDVKTLSRLLKKEADSNFFTTLYRINADRNEWVIKKLLEELDTLEDKKIVLMGVTYKPFTSTVRRSPATEIAKILKEQGASCIAIDPMADLGELSEKEKDEICFTLESSHDKAFDKADAAIVVTDWPQFKELDWNNLKSRMKRPFIIDCKRLFESQNLPKEFVHIVPGKPVEVENEAE